MFFKSTWISNFKIFQAVVAFSTVMALLFLTSRPFKKNSKLQIMASPSFLEFFFVPSKSAILLGNELVDITK